MNRSAARLRFLPENHDLSDAELGEHAFDLAREFGAQLPAIRALLVSDIQAAFTGDPAAQHITEILLCYPGVWAMTHHRLAHALHKLGVPCSRASSTRSRTRRPASTSTRARPSGRAFSSITGRAS